MNYVVNVPITSIRPDPGQPREEKPAEDIQSMSQAFLENGFDAHITIRPDPEVDIEFTGVPNQANCTKFIEAGGKFMVIKGECRWTCFTVNADLLKEYDGAITCFVDTRKRDAKTIFLDQVAENVNRIQMSPMNTARAYGTAIEKGATLEETAKAFGKQPGFIQSEMDLLVLPRFIQNSVDAGDLPKTIAKEIAKEPNDARRGLAYKAAMKGKGAKAMQSKLEAWRAQDSQKTIETVFGTQDAQPEEIEKAGKAVDKLIKAVNAFSSNAGDKGGLVIKARSKQMPKLRLLAKEMIRQGQMLEENALLFESFTGVKTEKKKAS